MGCPLSGPEFGYRRRARVAVRWDVKARQLEVGFRAEASQDIIAIDDCAVLVQPLQSILRHLPTVLRSLSKPQALGHVELFSGTAEAVLVRHVAPLPAEDQARLQAFCEQANAQLWLQGEGEPAPVDPAAQLGFALAPWQLELAWRPGDFVQVNAQVNTAMIEQALAWLAPQADERVLDLFCGLGNFALPLARQAREVVAVEGVQAMVDRAAANARTTMCITHGFSGRFIAAFGRHRMGRRGLFCGTLGSTARRCFRGGARHRPPQGQKAGLRIVQPGHAGERRPSAGRPGVPVKKGRDSRHVSSDGACRGHGVIRSGLADWPLGAVATEGRPHGDRQHTRMVCCMER